MPPIGALIPTHCKADGGGLPLSLKVETDYSEQEFVLPKGTDITVLALRTHEV